MKLHTSKKTTFTFIFVVFFVLLDKFLKNLVLKGLLEDQTCLISDIFCLKFAPNYNIAFSLPFSGPILTTLISIIIIILLYLWVYLVRKGQKNEYLLLTFLIIGAIINLLDRIKYGYVIDYFDLKYFTVFNVADIMITVSVFVLIILNLKNKKNERKY